MNKQKLLSILSHAAIFFSSAVVSVAIPLTIYFVSDDLVIKENAKESLNFHLNIWFWGIIIGVLTFLLIGWLFLPILLLVSWVMPIIAIFQILKDSDQPFRYPLIWRLL